MAGLWNTVKDLLFPRRCIFCHEMVSGSAPCCPSCKSQLPSTRGMLCLKCGCRKTACTCNRRILYYRGCIAPLFYNKMVTLGIRHFKKRGIGYDAEYLAGLIYTDLLTYYAAVNFDFVTFVPMHAKKQRSKGFNQAELLAQELSRMLQKPCIGGLLTHSATAQPQKKLSRTDRLRNVELAFSPAPPPVNPAVKDAAILLVDDIHTTGSTLNRCARLLKEMGADSVYAAVIAAA